jgi:hypothetical protein
VSAHARIHAKPGPVQVILKAFMVHASLEDPQPNWEKYGSEALAWWEKFYARFCARSGRAEDESVLAEELVSMLRKKSETWGKILRGDAN